MTSARDQVINLVWAGADPYAGFPEQLYEYDVQGWNSGHRFLTSSIDMLDNPTVIVEVGVWKGGSTITMADHLKSLDRNGVVIAVDTWLGSSEHWLKEEWRKALSFSQGRPMMQNKFMSNVCRRNLQDYVVPFPLDSTNACEVIRQHGIKPNLVHIDGGHDYSTVHSDVSKWWSVLAPGGYLIADDYGHPFWREVTQAVDDFVKSLEGVTFEAADSKCRIQKPSAS